MSGTTKSLEVFEYIYYFILIWVYVSSWMLSSENMYGAMVREIHPKKKEGPAFIKKNP